MDPIGLEELNGEASLLTRKDRKYLVPLALAQELVGQDGVLVLEIDGLRSFRYESVYFDTPDRISYLAAAHKRRRRFKVRTRSYLDSGLCSLEVKTRERRGLTEKHRLPYAIEQRTPHQEALEFVNRFETIAPVSRRLRPTLTTRYTRTTLLDTSSGESDHHRHRSPSPKPPDGSSVSLPDMAVVETKTSGQPCRSTTSCGRRTGAPSVQQVLHQPRRADPGIAGEQVESSPPDLLRLDPGARHGHDRTQSPGSTPPWTNG